MGLKLYDLDAERGTVFIRQGKGKKDRMIPMGERAFAWVQRYIEEARPSLALTPDDGIVFLTNTGLVFETNRLTQFVRDYVTAAEIGKTGSCHLFRHSCATLMLENGADIRFIQQLLGHEKLETTQIYAQVSIRMLKGGPHPHPSGAADGHERRQRAGRARPGQRRTRRRAGRGGSRACRRAGRRIVLRL